MRVLSVPELCCPNCVAKIEEALKDSVVKHFEVSLENKSAIVTLNKEVENSVLKSVIEDAGFEVAEID